MHNASRSRTSSGSSRTTATLSTFQTDAPEHVRPPTPAALVEHCLRSLTQPGGLRTVIRRHADKTWTEQVTVEMDMRALHDTANKLSLDLDLIARGLKGLSHVLQRAEALPPDIREVNDAQAFIDAYGEHFGLTDSMARAQILINAWRVKNKVSSIPFEV